MRDKVKSMNFVDVYEMGRTVGIDHANALDLTFVTLDNLYESDEIIYVPTYLALRASGNTKELADKNAKRYVAAVKDLAEHS